MRIPLGVVVSLLLLLLGCKKKTLGAPDVNARVANWQNQVTINNGPVELGQKVKYGDTIRTGEEGTIRLFIGARNALELGNSSEMRYMVADGDGLVRLEKGQLSAVLLDKSRAKEFRVQTSSVTAGVQNAVLFMKTEDQNRAYVCLCHGHAELISADNSDKAPIEARRHNANSYIKKTDRIQINKEELKYHSDESQQALAASVGHTITWASRAE